MNGGGTKNDAAAAEESAAAAATKQMSTVVELMRQQLEWSMRSERGKRDHDIGSAEALETRMRGIEVLNLPIQDSLTMLLRRSMQAPTDAVVHACIVTQYFDPSFSKLSTTNTSSI